MLLITHVRAREIGVGKQGADGGMDGMAWHGMSAGLDNAFIGLLNAGSAKAL